MEWIKVSDRTPEQLETILIFDSVSDLTISIGHRDKKGFNDWVSDEYVNITHWAKLTKPQN